MAERGRWLAGVGWLTGLSVAAVLAINIAGIVGIAVARRGLLEEAERALRLETAARADAIESVLASTRADLAFLTGSPVFFGLETALSSTDPREARWRRLEAEGALLLFLRGHPEVTHLLAQSKDGAPLLQAARRGGVPVLWKSTPEGAARPARTRPVDPVQGPITGLFEFSTGTRKVSGAVTLEATLDATKLLARDAAPGGSSRDCVLADGDGGVLAREPGARERPRGSLAAVAAVTTEGWSASAPWRLTCGRSREAIVALVEPIASRYRMTLALNVAGMSLALLLGAFAIQQTRRRQLLEATAREEARVRELERQLFHAERLSTVGRLAAGIAHEINNPLEGMSNYLGLARDDLARGDADSARKRLDGVQEGLQRAVEIVRRVLAHADPSAAPKTPIDLEPVLRQSVDFVRSRPEFRGIGFTLDVPNGRLGVLGSPAMLGQVFLNLLLNACEAQPGGGEVRVGARRQGGRVVVEIADRGPGVPPGEAGKIFEPFYSTKHSTGLGLSICYSIARQHEAELRVEGRSGGGAVFTLLFPAREEADA